MNLLKKSDHILLLFITLTIALTSCNATLKIKDGSLAYDLKKYALAAELLQEDFEKAKDKKSKYEIAVKIGKSYRAFSNTVAAENWFKTAADLDVDPAALLDYALVLKQNEKYAEAIETLKIYYQLDRSQRIIVEKHTAACEEVIKAKAEKTYTKIINLADVNTEFSEFGTTVNNGELLFSSNRKSSEGKTDDWTGKGYANIYSALIQNESKMDEAILWRSDINSIWHEGTVAVNKDETEVYFTRCGSDSDTKDVCKIYRSIKDFDTWTAPHEVVLIDDSSNVGHPFISADGKLLYFSSDAEIGYGGKDIYVSKRVGEDWDVPMNLGPRINTPDDEMFPYIAKDGMLYFASSGHYGYGGLDLFRAEKRGQIFTNVETLGYPINTGGDDFGIYLLDSYDDSVEILGYLSSNRIGGMGSDDLYFFEKRLTPEPILPPAVFVLKGIVEEKILSDPNNPKSSVVGQQPLNAANADILDNTDPTKPYLIERLVTKKEGTFEIALDEDVDYLLEYSKAGYFTNKDVVSTKNYNAKDGDTIIINKSIVLDKVFEEIEFVLNIYYDLDSANIRPDAALVLDSLANILAENPSLQVELASHTDSRGGDDYNLDLSQRRADSAVRYLIKSGISEGRLIAKGYGETRLVNGCGNGIACTEQQHQENRRTTFKVVGINFQLKE
jgi:outer membrane protein OmpA-like peptidoglycan-associated protein